MVQPRTRHEAAHRTPAPENLRQRNFQALPIAGRVCGMLKQAHGIR
jgi:hypothetical protein